MLRSRLTPVLLIRNNGLVKTTRFSDDKYVGDPLNAVRIFNEKEADEIFVLDIDASTMQCEPNYALIRRIASECRMPLCYGGGIKDISSADRIIGLGVEKVALSSAAIEDPSIITGAAKLLGSQSIAVVLDVKKSLFRGYEVYTHNGKRKVNRKLNDLICEIESFGAGELVINSIDRDGTMEGYDLNLASTVRELSGLPLTVMGGAGSLEDVDQLIARCGVVGCAAGSLFVFKGKYRAVLINYPSFEKKLKALTQFEFQTTS